MDESVVSINNVILRRLCSYSSENLLLTLLQSTRLLADAINDTSFWIDLFHERSFGEIDKNAGAKILGKLFFATNEYFGYSLQYNDKTMFESAVSSFLVGKQHIWILTTQGIIYSRRNKISNDNDGKNIHDSWTISAIDEKIRKLRGIRSDDTILAIGDESVLILEPLGGAITPIDDSNLRDYYIGTRDDVMAIDDDNRVIGVTIMNKDSPDSIPTVTILTSPINTLLLRLNKLKLIPASRSGKWSFTNRVVSTSEPLVEGRIDNPTQTLEENNIIYYQGEYDAELVKDIVSWYDNSEYYGEGDAL